MARSTRAKPEIPTDEINLLIYPRRRRRGIRVQFSGVIASVFTPGGESALTTVIYLISPPADFFLIK